jgi:hypothetical protein
MNFKPDVRANVDLLEPRARNIAQQEMDRSQALDQKTAGLIAAALVLVAAGVAFASRIADLHAGPGARTLWAVIIGTALILLLVSLGFATSAIRPQAFRTVIHLDELDRWATPRFLERAPTQVRGELMQAHVAAVRAARSINKRKGDRLAAAFGFFAAAIIATVVLGLAVAIRLAENPHHHVSGRQQHAIKQPAAGASAGGGIQRSRRQLLLG